MGDEVMNDPMEILVWFKYGLRLNPIIWIGTMGAHHGNIYA